MHEFEITYDSVAPDVTLINVSGWLDAHTFELMDQTFNDLFQKGVSRMIVNLQNVEYISSAGAGVFIGALSTAQERKGEIVMMNPAEPVKEVFDLLGLSQIFKFTTNVQEGINLARGG